MGSNTAGTIVWREHQVERDDDEHDEVRHLEAGRQHHDDDEEEDDRDEEANDR